MLLSFRFRIGDNLNSQQPENKIFFSKFNVLIKRV